jgi:hypothetical protein
MKILNLFKKKEEPEQIQAVVEKPNNTIAIEKHKKRIYNLNEEFEKLSHNLSENELDYQQTRTERERSSDLLIRRMAIIKYEIEIREGLIRWLS